MQMVEMGGFGLNDVNTKTLERQRRFPDGEQEWYDNLRID